ncbi:hypothetical protein Trydic_g16125 [Trypoxylus dichotomus]
MEILVRKWKHQDILAPDDGENRHADIAQYAWVFGRLNDVDDHWVFASRGHRGKVLHWLRLAVKMTKEAI